MGMLIRRHRDRHEDQPEAKPKRQRNRRKGKAEQPEAPAPEASPYGELTDEQVAEAYATNVGGEATERDAQVAELQALESEDNSGE